MVRASGPEWALESALEWAPESAPQLGLLLAPPLGPAMGHASPPLVSELAWDVALVRP